MNIFSTITWRKHLWTNLFLEILQVANKIRIHNRLFCGNNFTSKIFKKLFLVESRFNIRQGCSLQPRTLLNCVTYDFMRVFEIAAIKTLENYQKNVCIKFLFNTVTRLQSTVYYQTKDCTTGTFWKSSERKGSYKI